MSSTADPSAPRPFDALQIPPAALDRGGFEVLRAAIIDDGLHVTLRPVFDDTRMWGRVLADIARQLAHTYEHQGRGAATDVIANIRQGFDTDLNSPPETVGAIAPLS
jgi:Domain of unknown function (DUF5076)